MSQERRKNIRVRMSGQVVANCRVMPQGVSGPSTFDVWPVRDIGLGGARVFIGPGIASETFAFLNIDLDMRTIGVIGKILWKQHRNEPGEAGVEFCWWPQEHDRRSLEYAIGNKFSYDQRLGL